MSAPDSAPAREPADARGLPVTGTPSGPTTTKVVTIVFAFLIGIIAALVAFVVTRHLGAEPLAAMVSSCGAFVGGYYLMTHTAEKLGFL
ncbi:hypothetical protein ACFWB1_26140 [Streptomyces goshikiensis]|uniref:hypothetical protein n=1 Tax=Streptomyces goshikiensis TaxID=1942 RepID=UPI0036C5434D